MRNNLPRKKGKEDYSREIAEQRLSFVEEKSGVTTAHHRRYSFDPGILPGNIENFSPLPIPLKTSKLLLKDVTARLSGVSGAQPDVRAGDRVCRRASALLTLFEWIESCCPFAEENGSGLAL